VKVYAENAQSREMSKAGSNPVRSHHTGDLTLRASTTQRHPYRATPQQYRHDHSFAESLPAMVPKISFAAMMEGSASHMQENITVIEIRPYRNGWQCFEAPGSRALA
jgi:hypothetical protein